MTKHGTTVTVVKSSIAKYQERNGFKRRYPLNGIPETPENIQYTDEEKEALRKPLIMHAREALAASK